ncbi:hypothetical protein FLL45_08225 [Aliikangiella marina]|uniref:OmpR/PhoB-type domain-containing protein n=1 Tax=Aliikangiella marina TaxID=1712262 RepID=A0A545TCJ4_9GAMM|nr:winged helix-turn-helix domain-containing protein [Aliikangiella marina]TQV74935.1 hypothetical protein FLL45_08225 [Aliikangiella marina]
MSEKYLSGEWMFDSSRHQLRKDEQIIALEPRILALLEYFLKNPQRTITREELIEQVWQGTNVSESAINWTIAQLRKSLGDNRKPRQYIQTLPKQGYQWLQPVEIVLPTFAETLSTTNTTTSLPRSPLEIQAHKAEPSFNSSKYPLRIGLLVLGLLIIGAVIWFFQASTATTPPLTGFAKPFATLPGNESNPSFSPDGQWLAYTHQDYRAQTTRLLIKPLAEPGRFLAYDDENKAHSKTVPSERMLPESQVAHAAFIRTPSWAPHAKQIAYMQYAQGQCEIRLIRFNRLMAVTENKLIRVCHPDGLSQVSWGNNANQFYFTDRLDNAPYQVWRYEISQHKATPVTQVEGANGFHLVRVSPTEETAIVINDINRKQSDFYWLDLESGATEMLFSQKGVYYDIDWNADGSAFYFNHGQQYLYRFDINKRIASVIYSVTSNEVYGLVQSPDKTNHAFVSASTNRNRIDWFDFEGQEISIATDSTYQENLPAITGNSESLFYVSDRSGLPQVWHKKIHLPNGDSAEIQITNASEFYLFSAIHVSYDGQDVVGESDGKIQSFNIKNESFWQHSSSEKQSANPIFDNSLDNIIFAQLVGQTWQLVKVPYSSVMSEPSSITEQGGYYSTFDKQGNLYFSKRNQCGLWKIEADYTNEVLVSPEICIDSNSLSVANGILYFEDLRSQEKGIFAFDLTSQSIKLLVDRNHYPGKGFSIDRKQQRIAVHRRIPIEADIFIIDSAD